MAPAFASWVGWMDRIAVKVVMLSSSNNPLSLRVSNPQSSESDKLSFIEDTRVSGRSHGFVDVML
jgi:hypothetical protein